MQGTSANYAPYVDEIRTGAMIEFELIDVDAAQSATASCNTAAASFASLPQTHNRITQNSMKLATLEPNLWSLDGSYSLPNHVDNLETGYFSSTLSDADGNCNVIVTYTFPQLQDSDGFTVIFDTKATAEVADTFTIATYNGNTLLGSTTVTGNREAYCYVPAQSEGYNKVILTFTKTAKPYRRIRLVEFVFGHLQQFKADKILNMRVKYEAGLYMDSMPANMLTFTIDNSDRAYNVMNPTGIYKYLQEGQGINAALYVNGENVNMGRFYFEKATANDDGLTATVEAYDLLYRLNKTDCNIGASGTWTFAQAVAAIIADSGVDIVVNIDSTLGARVIRKCIPQNTTHREALRMAAQAARVILYFNRIGELKAREYSWSNPVDALTARNVRGWGSGTDTGLVNNVIVEAKDNYTGTVTTYTANDRRSGEPLQTIKLQVPLANGQEVANWILQNSKHRYVYETPAQSNPARDIGDCVNLTNVYGESSNVVVTMQDTTFDGALVDTIRAYGGGA